MKSAAIVTALFLTKQAFSSGAWNYEHMDHWSHSFSMCDNEDESPIDILTDEVVYDESVCTSEFEWDVDYNHSTFKISNNGHSVVLQPVQVTNIDPDNELEGTLSGADGLEYIALSLSENAIATLPNYFQPEHSEHDSFCLHSFHFHWGVGDDTGSEHLVDGHQYALEVHFVHYSCHHASLGSTLMQFPNEGNVSHLEHQGEDTHQLAVVGIFFDVVEGESNPAFEAMFEQLDNVALPGSEAHIVRDLDLSELIPSDIASKGYYAYEGSLTTPPCTNIVRWHVMKARSWIGSAQMEQFRELMMEEGVQIAPNFREVQDNVNTVYGCMAEPTETVVDDSTTRAIVWVYAVFTVFMPITLGVVCCWKSKKEKEALESKQEN